jgi:hypothetical protein
MIGRARAISSRAAGCSSDAAWAVRSVHASVTQTLSGSPAAPADDVEQAVRIGLEAGRRLAQDGREFVAVAGLRHDPPVHAVEGLRHGGSIAPGARVARR